MISEQEKQQFLEVQNLAFAAAEHTRNLLAPGITEIEAAKLMQNYLQKSSVEQYFHLPFVWFGERTKFQNFSRPLPLLQKKTWKDLRLPSFKNPLPHFGFEFLPTNKKLEDNMAVILDVAPAIGDIAVDIGYSFYFGENQDYQKATDLLLEIKQQIPQIVLKEQVISRIYQAVDDIITQAGYENCHQLYPLGVLGHKLGKLPLTWAPKFNVLGFHPQAFLYLLKEDLTAPFKFGDKTPYLASHINHPISQGLWAIEPHFGKSDWGLKFEEILVVEKDHCYWLSEEAANKP